MAQQKRTHEQQRMTHLKKGLGIGQSAAAMVAHQKRRNDKDRNHGDLTLDQAYDITAEVLIRQGGKCWITGSDLLVNGYADHFRSYSIDRLDDSKGYSVNNCRAVCVFINYATTCLPKPEQKLGLWRYLAQLPTLLANPDDLDGGSVVPNFAGYYREREVMRFAITGDSTKKTRLRAITWQTYFDKPKITPFYQMSDQEVMGLLSCDD